MNTKPPFKFSEGKDALGVPLESAAYVRKDCRHCYGRGFRSFLVGDGYKVVDGKKAVNDDRDCHTCPCVIRGYARARQQVVSK